MPRKNLLTSSVLKFPQLSLLNLYCCISQYPDISLPIKLSASGAVVSSDGTEYTNVKEWTSYEFFTCLPPEADISKLKIQSKRDFFTEPGRKGRPFYRILHNLHTSVESEIDNGPKTSHFLSHISDKSPLTLNELMLYSLMRISAFKYANYRDALAKFVHVLNKFDSNILIEDDLETLFLNSEDLLVKRYNIFSDIVKSFTHENAHQLIKALNDEDFDESIFDDAQFVCDNFKISRQICNLTYENDNAFCTLKYSWPLISHNFPLWSHQIQRNEQSSFLCKHDIRRSNLNEKCVEIHADLDFSVLIHGQKIDFDWTDLPKKITSNADIVEILNFTDSLKICNGFQICDFTDVTKENMKDSFYIIDSYVRGVKTGNFLKSPSCLHATSPMAINLCVNCNNLRNHLYKKRFTKKTHNIKHPNKINYKFKSKDELAKDCAKMSSKYRDLEKKISNLKSKLEHTEKVLSGDDKDLREMFINLQEGFLALNEKVNNLICCWSQCSAGTFDCIYDLLKHIDNAHLMEGNESVKAPIDKVYSCNWIHCKKAF
ncbi:unnamed protein product [Mytilus coruscus]|uniref:Uncharacterized protein n=1 Tax=Mytilus coruscus TaxID=42192 RepID=A0A6J8AGS8_MYTCO|nr:unnamed protein product [Mytilus coruscus]